MITNLNRQNMLITLFAALCICTSCANKQDTGKKVKVLFSAGEKGVIKTKPAISSGGTAVQDSIMLFTAVPNDPNAYEVDTWTITGGKLISGGTPGSITAEVKITEETSVAVTFKVKSLTYNVGNVSFTLKPIESTGDVKVGLPDYKFNLPHSVRLTKYYIGETEITQELWTAVMGENPSIFNGKKDKTMPDDGEIQGKRPVDNVNWFDCIVFCNKLTSMTPLTASECVYRNKDDNAVYTKEHAKDKKEPVMDITKKGFRLPTEAEWEVAALGGTSNLWAGTNDADSLGDYAWYLHNAFNKTHEVKKKMPNGYGLYDMSGNVSEWCWDRNDDTSPKGGQDPTGVAIGTRRAWRNGSYSTIADVCLCGFRDSYMPDYTNLTIGLRIVRR